MSKVKSIIKRSLAILLALLTIMSVGVTSILAATVELAPIAANHSGGYLYFVKPSSWSNASYIVGHDSYYRVYPMTKLSGNLYYLAVSSFDGWNGWGFVDTATASTGGKVWDKYKTYSHYTGLHTSYALNSGSTYLVVGSSTNDSSISPSYYSSGYSGITTYSQKAYAYYTTNGSTYTNGTTGGTVKVTTYQLSGNGSGSSASTSASSSASRTAVTGSSVTMTASAASGYKFLGWFTSTSATTATSTNPTYTYNCSAAKTMYARFEKSSYSYSVVANPTAGGSVTHNGTGSVTPGFDVKVTATPEDGYNFTGWTGTNGTFADKSALSTTFTPTANNAVATANFALKTYTVTFKDWDGEVLDTVEVSHGGTANAPAATREGYTFTGWSEAITNVTGDMEVTAQYTINSYTLTITGFDSTKADMDIDGTTYFDDDTITKTYGSTSTVTITPVEGQVLTVNGETIPYGESYEAEITYKSNTTLNLGFNIKTFDVTINQSGAVGTVKIDDVEFNGSSDTKAIEYGSKNLYVKAPANYYIKSINGNQVVYTDNGELKNESPTNMLMITDEDTINVVYAEMPKFALTVEQSGYDPDLPASNFDLNVAGNNHTNDGPSAKVTENLYGGNYTISINAPLYHYIPQLKVDGVDVTAESYTSEGIYYYVSYTVNLTADTTVEVTYKYNPIVHIAAYYDGVAGEDIALPTPITYGVKQEISVPAKEGYYISKVTGTINGDSVDHTSSDYSNDTFTETIDFLKADTELVVYYTAIPTFEVTVNVNDANGGTATGVGIENGVVTVYSGSMANLSATANTGYRFTGWTVSPADAVNTSQVDLTQPSISFVPQTDVTVTANFTSNDGTVNLFAGEGGSIPNAGSHGVTYPKTVSAFAEADEENGYQFTHWTVESEGKEGTDYLVTEDGNEIEIQVLTHGTVVNVTANFANSQKIKVYTYSDSGFNKLYLTESNGSDTKEVYNATQTLVHFGDKNWYTPSIGELTLTAGYNDAINAQLLTSVSSVEGGTIIYVELSDAWTNTAYAYKEPHLAVTSSANSSWSGKIGVDDTTGVSRAGSSGNDTNYRADKDTYIGGGTYVSGNIYKFVIPSTSLSDLQNYGFTVYSKQWINNDMWEINIAHGTYSSTVNRYKISENNTKNADRNTFCFDISSNGNMSSESAVVDIADALYNGNEWRGLDEIWIYFDNNGGYTATNRRQLNDYVTGSLIRNAYNNGENDEGYTDKSWSDFTSAYEDAMAKLGAGASTQTDIDSAYSTLKTKFEALELTNTVTITGSNGAMPGFGTYYGTISFPGITTTSHTGNIGDADSNGSSPNCTYYTATVTRGQSISINTTVNDSDYMVLGWVVNGTDFVEATQDIENTNLFTGAYPCTNNAVIIPVYFRDDTIAKYKSEDEDERKQVIKLYAKGDDSSTTWGNYISAYTWTGNDYKQFGRWTGQVMIPDRNNPGMYYTYVEKFDPDNPSDVVEGITFNNYGNNTGIYTGIRYQTYDYYEFMGLAEGGYDTIVFELNESDGVQNWPSKSAINVESNDYNFYPFVDFSGNEIDISRTKLTDEQKALDTALYIVRTGPCDADDSEVGKPTGSVIDGEYFINCYIYDAQTGDYIGACKSYELLDLEALKNGSRKLDLTSYIGKPVEVDYASLTETNAKRYDGEWYGTIYGLTNVTIKAEVAFQKENGEIQYFQGQNNVDGVGQAYFNGEHLGEVSHGSENHTISASIADGNDFVGWYKAIVADDGTYTIDATAKPLFIERSVSTIDASADAIYVAVFKEHPEGLFTVNNYYYTHADFKGQPMGEHLPPVFGGNINYSIRDVRINKVEDYQGNTITNGNLGFAGTDSQSVEVSVGDVLEITIKTTPTYKERDYVYAWYIQANESDGKVNFEEIGTNVIQGDTTPGVTKEFTFTYTVEPGVNSITIYSDVVHISPEVTFTYIYTNRYNQEQKYVVKHTLTDEELKAFDNLKDNEEFNNKIRDLAPYVADIYKNVTWEITNISSDATNWTLRATESDVYTVNVNVNGEYQTFEGKFNETVSIYAKDIDDTVTGNSGIWYLDKSEPSDGEFDPGEDEILGYGTYYGLVITGDADVYFTNETDLVNQIILADAVYGYERATDGDGNETVNKVYVDYLISMLLNVYTGDYIDINGNDVQDDNEPTVIDEENTNTPASVKAIEAAGYKVDYGMIHELLNTFGDNKQTIIDNFYGKSATAMTDEKLTEMLISGKGTANGASYNGSLATLLYKYSAIDFKDYATNKNRVIMTFGFDNTEYNRNLYYNVKAYLTISASDAETMDESNTMFLFSNQATLNIAEDDKVTNGVAN